jgi:hypothetical protein
MNVIGYSFMIFLPKKLSRDVTFISVLAGLSTGAPFGYFFVYFYYELRINKITFIFYITAWSIIGITFQWIATLLHILTYQNNYQLSYSFPIFLLTQTLTGIFYVFITSNDSSKLM